MGGAPSLCIIALGCPVAPLLLWFLRFSLLRLPVVPLFRRSRVLFPSVPLLLRVPRCSRLLPPAVAPPLLLWSVVPLLPVVGPGCILRCSRYEQQKKRRAKKTEKKQKKNRK